MEENPFLLNSVCLSNRAINKKQNYLLLLEHQLAENSILVFGFYERTKEG